jgi:V8-like Glu-specific endopeptidase
LRWLARPIGIAALVSASPLVAAIFDHDDRISMQADPTSAFAPIGMIWGDKLATGFLVDKCHVLTVQHAFGDERTPVGREVVFGALIVDEQHWTWSWGKVVAAGGLEQHASDYDSARAADWALIRLRKCLGATVGYVSLVSADPGSLPDLQSAGYPSDRKWTQGITLDPACRMRGARGPVWLNDCAALTGNSGSPIFTRSEKGRRLQVYAIQSAAYEITDDGLPFDPGYANVATPMAEILPHIRKFLRPAAETTKFSRTAD